MNRMKKFRRKLLIAGLAVWMAGTSAGGSMVVLATELTTETSNEARTTGATSPQADPVSATAEEKNKAVSDLYTILEGYKNHTNYESIRREIEIARIKVEQGNQSKADLDAFVELEKGIVKVLASAGSGSSNQPPAPVPDVPNTDSGNSNGSDNSDNSGNKEDSKDTSYINDDQRADADEEMVNYKETLIRREDPEQYILDELDSILYSGIYYIANSEKMTEVQMWDYVGKVKGQMDAAVEKSGTVTTTTEFLTLAHNWRTPSVSYGQSVNIVLPLINLGEEWLTDILVEPEVTNDVATWPFVPETTGYTQNFSEIPGCATRLYDEAIFNRREVTYAFTARQDVLTGYYPLKFKVWYSKDGIRCTEPAEVSVFVYCQGKPGSGRIGMSEETNVSQPRIIVTGFETDPETVYAGDIFTLNIHVKNTSVDTAVNNVLFDLEAVEGGTEGANGTTTNSYAAFLPTSGSSAIYVARMPAGSSQDLKIEMQAKADLSQKPYVVTVKMKYDTDLKADLSDEAKVSIPVKQESKFDASTPEINPTDIMVGEQSNVMFQIYNTGKTTLYNVQVKFEADSVEGGDTFIGNLQPGGTGNVDAMVTGIAATMDDGTVKAVITYEDDAGNQTREEKDITIFVNEMMMDDGMMDMPMEPEEEEKPQAPLTRILLIVAAAVVVAVAAIVGILKFRKKKKAAKQLAEDLLDLDKDA